MPTIPPVDPVRLHQGGWDEMLIVAAPILLFIVIRWVARRRERRSEDESERGD